MPTGDDTLSEPCIGALEKHLHEVFAATLAPGEEFVHCPDAALFTALDEYCDEQSMGTVKPPLVVLSGSGGGKSALLANWKLRHERQGHRARVGAHDKFVFWHAVGCSRPSMQVSAMLRRLMTELAEHFELARPVPKDDDRLSWDFPRFLELAAKKGHVILLLDGMQNLVSGNAESGFKWLPLSLPPNVRVVLSATTNEPLPTRHPDDHSLRKQPRVLLELERRKWDRITLSPLPREMSAAIIEAYLKKTSEGDLGLSSSTFLTTGLEPSEVPLPPLKGLLLFQGQIDSILNHPAADNPLFLRILLRALHWGAARGYDLWALVDSLADVADAASLIKTIIRTFGHGCAPEELSRRKAENRSNEEGGFEHLRLRYSWHPFFQLLAQLDTQSTGGRKHLKQQAAMRSQSIRDVSQVARPAESISSVLSLGNSVVGNIGDQNWIKVKEEAEQKLHQARAEVEADIQSLLESASAIAENGKQSLVDVLWERRLNSPNTGLENQHLSALIGFEPFGGDQAGDGSPASTRKSRLSSADTNSEGARSARTIQVELPAYLRGGTSIDGFGKLLGNALALLYVARLGLKEAELWSILARLQAKELHADSGTRRPDTEEEKLLADIYPMRGALVDRLRLHDTRKSGYVTAEAVRMTVVDMLQKEDVPDTNGLLTAFGFTPPTDENVDEMLVRYTDLAQRCEKQLRAFRRKRLASRKQRARLANGTKPLGEEDESLDPDVEDNLLSLLSALGVLHSPESQVLVLPLGDSVLRQAVKESFVPDEAAESQWHAKLIAYFQECPNTLRKCEELPWHLQECRRWPALRDTLTDLSVFELMFRTRLRGELLQYWQVLTQGPLYLSDAAEARASETLSAAPSEQLLSVLDTSVVFGYTREQATRLAMAGRQAPFDIVHEYNIALEQWEQSPQATIPHLVSMEEAIAAMLLEFGKVVGAANLPTFLRVYPRADHLRAIDVQELPGAVEPQSDELLQPADDDAASPDADDHSSGPEATGKQEASTQQFARTLYDYHRWMWIQIPWLALRSVLTTQSNAIDSHRSDSSASFRGGGSMHAPQGVANTIRSGPSLASNSRIYWGLKKLDPRHPRETPKRRMPAPSSPSSKLTSSVKEQIRQITNARSKRPGALPSVGRSSSLPGSSSAESESFASGLPLVKPQRTATESSLVQSARETPTDPTEVLLSKILEAKDGNINGVLSQLLDPNLENPAYAAAVKSQVAERNEQLEKLRAMYDKLRMERKRKGFQADQLRTQYAEREVVGEQVVTDLEQAEKVMQALDERCATAIAAIEDASRLTRAYCKIVDFCRAHPANVQSRWNLLEQEKKLATRQCDDLMKRRRELYLLAEDIELHQKPAVQAEIDIHSKKRQQTQAAIAVLRQRLHDFTQKSQAESVFLTEAVDEEVGSATSGTDTAVSAREKQRAVKPGTVGTTNARTTVGETGDRHAQQHSRAQLLQRMLGLRNPEKMFHVFSDACKLGDSLANQKKVSDTRLQQLRAEYASCKQALADITMVEVDEQTSSPGRSAPSSPERIGTPESQEVRWLDDRYSATEMRLHQSARKATNTTSLVQQIKTGILHLAQLLVANRKMLEHLPGAPEQPSVDSDDDMLQLLVWCEEKVVAINEALVLDTTKPKAADDAKSLHERQTALAHSLASQRPGSSAAERSWPAKVHGVSISGALLRNEENYLVSSPRSIRVPSHSQADTVSEASGRSGGQPQEGTDAPSMVDDVEASHEELQALINEAFASEESQQEIRKANILANKKLGASASLGWAMEGVLKEIGMARSSKPSTPATPPSRSAHSSSRQSPTRIR